MYKPESPKPRQRLARNLILCWLTGVFAIGLHAANAAPAGAPAAAAPVREDRDLAGDEGRLAARYERLEQSLLRLAELTAGRNPRRAALLRDAIAKSKQQGIPGRFATIVRALEQGRLGVAAKGQEQLQRELDGLLQLLLKENHAERLESEKQRIRRYLKELNRLIRGQRGLKARTEGQDDAGPLAQAQGALAEKAGRLARGIAKDEGKQRPPRKDQSLATPPAGGKSNKKEPHPDSSKDRARRGAARGPGPAGDQKKQAKASQPNRPEPRDDTRTPNHAGAACKRVKTARQEMQKARKKIEDAKRRAAADNQQAAIDQLLRAKGLLDRILRQLREEEIEQILTRLEARFRKMLQQQLQVYDGTKKLDQVPVDRRNHEDEIEAARLQRKESVIADQADRALRLLREEGSSIAFPEAIQQMREAMREVANRLSRMRVGAITQEFEQEIIDSLQEAIQALQTARRDAEKRRARPGGPTPPGQPIEPPLVDVLAELRMIRSLQLRVNRRTTRYRALLDESGVERAEVVAALRRLARSEARIERAAHDLALGKNR